jgi:ferritin-like metal-binding protein YciE
VATKVTDPHDLLVHKLKVLLGTEREIEQMLPKLEQEAHDDELKEGFRRHLDETKQHVANVEQAFKVLGEDPQATATPAIKGLKTQHEGFASAAADDVLPDVLDAVSAGSAAATEHHEIAEYEGTITLAEGLGLSGVSEVLQKNLRDEKNMLQGVKQVAERISKKEEHEAAEVDRAEAEV